MTHCPCMEQCEGSYFFFAKISKTEINFFLDGCPCYSDFDCGANWPTTPMPTTTASTTFTTTAEQYKTTDRPRTTGRPDYPNYSTHW